MPTKDFKQLTTTLLGLPARQRVRLAQVLWDSIDPQFGAAPMDQKFLAEVRRRDREISDGRVRCKTHEQVMESARKAIGCSK